MKNNIWMISCSKDNDTHIIEVKCSLEKAKHFVFDEGGFITILKMMEKISDDDFHIETFCDESNCKIYRFSTVKHDYQIQIQMFQIAI